MVNLGGQIGQNMDTVAQRLVNNEMDSALDMRSSVIGNILVYSDIDHVTIAYSSFISTVITSAVLAALK